MNLPEQSLWWLNRSTGLVLLVMFTIVVILGIFATQKAAGRRLPTFVPNQLHRSISVFAIALLAAHILTSVLDSFVEIDWIDVVVPFVSPYRPFWLGLGTLAFDLTVAVLVTTWVKSRISERAWHQVHLLSYAAWLLAVVHGLGTGTDSKNPWVVCTYLICVLSVAIALAARITWTQELSNVTRTLLIIGVAVVPIALAWWALLGPLAPGWSAKAGTPSASSQPSQELIGGRALV